MTGTMKDFDAQFFEQYKLRLEALEEFQDEIRLARQDVKQEPSAADRTYGQRLREARELAGLSKRAAANALGLASHSNVSAYEEGRCRPRPKRLMLIEQVYGVAAADLVMPPGSPWTKRK